MRVAPRRVWREEERAGLTRLVHSQADECAALAANPHRSTGGQGDAEQGHRREDGRALRNVGKSHAGICAGRVGYRCSYCNGIAQTGICLAY